jgi:hypothetical protein
MKLPAILTKHALKACGAAAALGAALAPASALDVTTWNWSFTTDIADQFASGTFTTADVTPAAGTTYQITGISGTYNRGGTAYSITELTLTYPNLFQWNGSTNSPLLIDFAGFQFMAEGNAINVSHNGTGFQSASTTGTTFTGNDGLITSSLLSPVNEVPGPLPLLGAAAAFQASRRIRRRLNSTALDT